MDSAASKLGKFDDILRDFRLCEGMTGELSAALWDFFLSAQTASSVSGHLVEFGVYKGKSAVVLLGHAEKGERVLGIDVNRYPDLSDIVIDNPTFEFYQMWSEEFFEKTPDVNSLLGKCRFIHSDGSHTFSNVKTDIETSERLICDGGIVALDDFYNGHYPAVAAAAYVHVSSPGSALRPFLMADNKAYFCKKNDHKAMKRLVVSRVVPEMKSRGYSVFMSQTDKIDWLDMICLHYKNSEADPDFWGDESLIQLD